MKKWSLFPIFLISSFFVLPVLAADPADLKTAIEAKLEELKQINLQILKTEQEINVTQTQQKSLKNELTVINGTVNQVNLGIRASQLTIEKLNLELSSLQNQITEVEADITLKREAIVELLRELQAADQNTFLLALLKSQSLAESFAEVQSVQSVNEELSDEVVSLKTLQIDLNTAYETRTGKRKKVVSENATLKNRQAILIDQKAQRNQLLAQTQNQEKIYKQQLSELEKKQGEISDAIEEIEIELRKTFDPTILPIKRHSVLDWPLENHRLTQRWGEVSRLYRGKPHNGVDFGASLGTPVLAADDGEIIGAGNNGRYQYGRYIVIKHSNNLATLYAHLSRQSVGQGAIVKKGDIIGYSGSTGYSTGPHLHFGLYWAPTLRFQSVSGCNCGLVPIGVSIDPLDYLP